MRKATALVLSGLAALVMGCGSGDKFYVEVPTAPGSSESVSVECKVLPDKGTLFLTLPDGTRARYDVGQGYIWQNPPVNGEAIIKACLQKYPDLGKILVYGSQIGK